MAAQASFLFPLMNVLSERYFYSENRLLDPLQVYQDREECARIREACRRSDEALRRVMEDGSRWAAGQG